MLGMTAAPLRRRMSSAASSASAIVDEWCGSGDGAAPVAAKKKAKEPSIGELLNLGAAEHYDEIPNT